MACGHTRDGEGEVLHVLLDLDIIEAASNETLSWMYQLEVRKVGVLSSLTLASKTVP
jgi:hypothetical protein